MFYVLIINLVGLVLCSGPSSTLYLNIEGSGRRLTCQDSAVTVLEGQSLIIQVNYDKLIYKITCEFRYNGFKKVESNMNFLTLNFSMEYMSGTLWTCTIIMSTTVLRDLYKPSLETQGFEADYTWASVECRIKMHVRLKVVPIVILVNGMLLPSKQAALNDSHDALVEYTFTDGDLVEVTCAVRRLSTISVHSISMDYDYIKRVRITDNNDGNKYPDPVGFKLRMRADYNNTYAICTSNIIFNNIYFDTSTVRINFFLRKLPIDKALNVYINDAALRPTTNRMDFEYFYKTFDHIYIACESEPASDTVQFKWTSEQSYNNVQWALIKTNKGVTLFPNNYYMTSSFQCVTKTDKVEVKLSQRRLYINESEYECLMRAWIEHSNATVEPLQELYQYGNHDLIYEYKNNDSFYLKWKGWCRGERASDYLLLLVNSRDYKKRIHAENGLHTLYISQSEIDKNSVFKWIVIYMPTNETILSKTIVFIHALPTAAATTTTTTTHINKEGATIMPSHIDQEDKEGTKVSSITVVIGSVACVVIICVVLGIYKMRNRYNKGNQQPDELNYENQTQGINSPIPPFPRQCRFTEFTDLTEPCNTENELYKTSLPILHNTIQSTENELYNIPMVHTTQSTDITVHEQTNKNLSVQLNYVEIMHSKHLDPENPMVLRNDNNVNYVEVQNWCGKEQEGVGSMYANVNDVRYANAASEYAEPTYCEPIYLNKKK